MHNPRLLMVICLGAFVACSPASDDDGESSAGPRPSSATRSSTCLTWQDATCDYLADKCQSVARDYCDDYTQSLFCESDETVQACIDALATGTCPNTPEACQGVADRAPAKWYCLTFIEALCDRGEACNLESKDQCVESANASLDCDETVGVGPTMETCLSQLGSLSCAALNAYQLPAACQGVFKVDESVTRTSSEKRGLAPMFSSAWQERRFR
jgi:hypothetical protein